MGEDRAYLSHPCHRARSETQNLNVKWALESRKKKKKDQRWENTEPQLSHDNLGFPDDVDSRGMKDEVRGTPSCCKHVSERAALFLAFCFLTHG